MAEYRKEIVTTVSVAIILAALLGATAIYLFPSFGKGNTTVSNRTSVTVITQQTSTIPPARTYTNQTVSLDPRLSVTPMQGLLESSSNATEIANALASGLQEAPIQLLSHRPATCVASSTSCIESNYPYSTAVDLYVFRTAKGSNITVNLIQGKFFELQYVVQDFDALYNGYLNNHTGAIYPPPSASAASAKVADLMLESFGIDLSKVSLVNNVTGPIWVQWSQQFQGLNIANSGVVYFEFYPLTSQVIRMVIDENGGWHLVPSNFPLDIPPSNALSSAKAYAITTLEMGSINYAKTSLQVIQSHLYYALTVANQTMTYVLYVNPITGVVGYPSSS